ncbi:MAG TPA: hypothetical protein VNG91_00365 [Terriglobia bacterium]|nr:hypothetical protein [Terriglobia bacterium]HVB28238.1 hypothetical protein [Terriglobia bacterium]
MSTQRQPQFPGPLQDVLDHGLLKRLPITFLPSTNQQLAGWSTLFPYEQHNLLRTLTYLGSLDAGSFNALFQRIRELETLMQVGNWPFSTQTLTLQDASLLARSPYYLQWRQEVNRVFERIDGESRKMDRTMQERQPNRLVLIILPPNLPVDRASAWKPWRGEGRELALDLSGINSARPFREVFFNLGNGKDPTTNFLQTVAKRPGHLASDLWVVDAERMLAPVLATSVAPASPDSVAICLSFARLKAFRQAFLQRLNSMRKDLSDADKIYALLRKTNVSPWCPPGVAQDPTVVEFLRSLFLSGNGALIFGNSFVEWTATEAFRRARPQVLVAAMGTRQKPKPFTSVAVFENQEVASPLPSVPDLPGSALDASMLARYVWLGASRYAEYDRALCLCLHENLPVAYAVGPRQLPLWNEPQPIKPERLQAHLNSWVAG